MGSPKNRAFASASLVLAILFVQFYVSLAAAPGGGPGPKLKRCNLNKLYVSQGPNMHTKCDIVSDYVVVGTGAGGAPVIKLLSDDPHYSVVALEAGENKDDDPVVFLPANNRIAANVRTSSYNWMMKTANAPIINKVLDVSIGRMLGGATSHNGMMYMKGSPYYFADWVNYGGSDWSLAEINAAYLRMENCWNVTLPDRGVGGPSDIKRSDVGPTSGPGAFVYKITQWTSAATGIPITPDYNGQTQPYGPYYRFDLSVTQDGKRESASRAFLGADVMHPNGTGVGNRKLRVLFRSTATKVIFDGNNKAVGIKFIRDGETTIAWAQRGIILAGNIFSTQILQNSGVGNATHLESLGIPVVYDNPNVGKHLANHPLVSVPFVANPYDVPLVYPDHSGICAGAILPQWHANLTYNPADLTQPRKYQVFWLNTGGNNFVAATLFMRPKSTGSVLTQSADPLQVPLHDEQMMISEPSDLDDFASFLYYYYQGTLLPYLQSQDPSYSGGWGNWTDVEAAKTWLLARLGTAYHYTGTNRMALSSEDGVVDHRGRVYGVTNLYVSDTTIIPTTPDGNTDAVARMVGSRIAEMIVAHR